MGIPSYFSYIIKNHPNIIRNLGFFKNGADFQHLYMDCNSIIYDAVNSIKQLTDDFEKLIIDKVIDHIDFYIRMINPTTTIFVAFDGVAPFAKMDQQRKRRYRTQFLSTLDFGKDTKRNSWNTSSITPGTDFMDKLSSRIYAAFRNSEKKYNVKNVLVSCSDEKGEGEHKLFKHLRNNNFKNDTVAVYGLDSDLIMLSIFHLKYCDNIYIFREAPAFLKSFIPIDTNGKENEPHFLDISHLSTNISFEMACKHTDLHRTVDYVFICFLLGNDFLPHFPAMNIRTHGIQALLDIYRNYIGNFSERFLVSKDNRIIWKNVGIFISQIAKREHEFLSNEYFVRNKMEKRPFPENTPEEKEDYFNNIPIIYRNQEKYICPDEPYWENRYYKALFNVEKNATNIKKICNNYLEGLEWVLKYYTFDCPDWKWKYNYHYPPLFIDLLKYIPNYEKDFLRKNNSNAFSTRAQLSYVLPRSNLYLLPKKSSEFLEKNCHEFYPDTYDFQWAFCKYFWEAHPILPEISIGLLEKWEKQII